MKDDVKYEALSGDASSETSSDETLSQLKSLRRQKHWSVLSFSTGCLTTILIVSIAFFIHRHVTTPKTAEQLEAEDWNYCGRSVESARARGCVMEPMFYGFMPKKCHFPDLSSQFPVFEDRPYYSDDNMTQLVTPQEMWDGKYPVVYTPK
ncbi:hypothetical protein GE09DRAFT_1064898 [Coniochaeta sp. 2T2.1]|nr:hypothetical protein GE09DRAFT_1064898 [Coniochaeta sp. 2T2.1]